MTDPENNTNPNIQPKQCLSSGVDVRYLEPNPPNLPNVFNVLKKFKKLPAKMLKLFDLDDFILDLVLFAIVIPDSEEKKKIFCFIKKQIEP